MSRCFTNKWSGASYSPTRMASTDSASTNPWIKATSIPENEQMFFIYDNAPADHNVINSGEQTELKPLPPFSPFFEYWKCVESGNQGWRIKTKHSLRTGTLRDCYETRRQGIPLGELRQRVVMQANARNLTTITVAKLMRCLESVHADLTSSLPQSWIYSTVNEQH